MPRYEVLQKSYINHREVMPGEVVEYEGKAGANLRLLADKEKSLSKYTRDELIDYAAAKKIEIEDIDNLTDEEILNEIREAEKTATI